MTNTHKTANDSLRLDLISACGKYFLCPDGTARKLCRYEIDDRYVCLEFDPVEKGGERMPYRWPIEAAAGKWKLFTRISQQQAQGKTALPPIKVNESLTPETTTHLNQPFIQNTNMDVKLTIEKELTGHIGKELNCPDGVVRTLKTFEMGKNGVTTLHWGAGQFKELSTGNFWNEWPTYQLTRKPDEPVAEVQLAQVSMTAQTKEVQLQAKAIIDTSDITQMLREQMQRVRSNSSAIPQAKTMGDLAKQIIEAEKLKLETIKVIHTINQK